MSDEKTSAITELYCWAAREAGERDEKKAKKPRNYHLILSTYRTKTDADFDEGSETSSSFFIIPLSTSSTIYETGNVHYSSMQESESYNYEESFVEECSIDEANQSKADN